MILEIARQISVLCHVFQAVHTVQLEQPNAGHQARLGPAQALVATAHKIARTVYHMLKDRVPYQDIGAAESNKRFRERGLKYLQKKAAKLGYKLSPA